MILTVNTYCAFEKRDVEIDWIFEEDVKLLYTRGCDNVCGSKDCNDCLSKSRELALLKLSALNIELDLKQP